MKTSDVGKREQRRDRMIRERVHDPYKTRLKLPEPTVCPTCGAVFRAGRWHWETTRPEGANEETCQACHRTSDSYPAGEVTLEGVFLAAHKDEILNLARNVETMNADGWHLVAAQVTTLNMRVEHHYWWEHIQGS